MTLIPSLPRRALSCVGAALLATGPACAIDPVLPDWTTATFDASSAQLTNPLLAFDTGRRRVIEGEIDDGEVEHIVVTVTWGTINILGVENAVVRDQAYVDGVLVETAYDWYAQDTDGNVWYFGEFVENYTYDDDGRLVKIDNEGSWIADGTENLPGVLMFAAPAVGDAYYQEFAPTVALDFASILDDDATVEIALGTFTGVLATGEGNLFDEPDGVIVETKSYAPNTGLVLIEELDDKGAPEFTLELIGLGCAADVNDDGGVDATDLAALLAAWGPCEHCATDLDADHAVTINDLILLLAHWSDC